MNGTEAGMAIEVVYATADASDFTRLALAKGATVRTAIERSGVLLRHPEIDSASVQTGVFGRPRSPDDLLSDGDRVEIYRPLSADPKAARVGRVREARRRRAQVSSTPR